MTTLTPSRPRHCMVVHAHYPLHEPRVTREAEALVDAGYDVDVLCLRGEGEPEREQHRGVEIHRLPARIDKRSLAHQLVSYVRFLSLAAGRLTTLHHRHPYRTIQVHNLPDFLVFCAVIPKMNGVPIILDLHDLMPEFFAGRFGSDERRLLPSMIRAQEHLACRFADHVITVSGQWRDTLVARGVAPEKCSVVMNVADDRIFNPRPRRRTSTSEFRLIYHGQVTRRYGLDLAVRAVALLRDEIPELRLTIRGRGDQVPELIALVRDLELQDRVELCHDSVPAEDLPDIIAAADLGVVPYRDDVFTDGIVPTKLMEYAAVGLPAVAARTTAIATYFTDTMTAFFTPGDVDDLARRIRELHANPDELARLAAGSRRFTGRHDWNRVKSGYVALVDALGSGARGSPTSSLRGTRAAPLHRRRGSPRGRTRAAAGRS